MENEKPKNRRLLVAAILAFSIGASYTTMVMTGRVNFPFACISAERATIPDISGMRFDITYTNCDVLAKQEAISVYVSAAKRAGSPLLDKLFRARSLLFRYDPDKDNSPLPQIKVLSDNTIIISVPAVSSINYQSQSWRRVSVKYNIGHVDYP